MRMESDELGELVKALAAAQMEMEHVAKDATNPFHKNKYGTLASTIDACRPVLNKHGLAVMQYCEPFGDKEYLVTKLAHTSGQWQKGMQVLTPQDNKPQSWGSCITYARRYGSKAMGFLADEDDDGQAASTPPIKKQEYAGKQPKQPAHVVPIEQPISEMQHKALLDNLTAKEVEDLCRRANIELLSDLPSSRFQATFEWAQKKHKARQFEEAQHG